ncbi:ABC transporter ATP-binding protein/permease [Spiroplasma endosymbiont of Diplazon laetatorius]|uniref:ABC transporter ATP-binding protein n=1 Tax=Spiroplasma endosymbiont of Diplazon laetatorius TaxID=3066322 RepID=UPI0030D46500
MKIFKSNLLIHILKSFKNKLLLTIIMFILITFMCLTLVLNIKIIEFIMALLISKSLIDSTNDYQQLINFLSHQLKDDPELLRDIIFKLATLTEKEIEIMIQDIIKTFFFNYVNYSNKSLYVIFWNLNLNLYKLTYTMIADILIFILLFYIVNIISGFIAKSYETKIQKQLINKLIDQDIDFFIKNKMSKLSNVLINDNITLSKFIKDGPFIYSFSFILIISSSSVMFHINWKLTTCVFGLLAIMICLIAIFYWLTNISTKKNYKKNIELYNDINEKIYSTKLIKTTGTFEKEKDEFEKKINFINKKNKRNYFVSEITGALIIGGIGSFAMASVIFGVILFYNQAQSLVTIITAFTAGVIIMTLPILQLRTVIYETPISKTAANNLTEILDSKIYINKHENLIFNEEFKTLEFKNLTFSYPENPKTIFSNMNFKLEKNNKYAFVGTSGSGKSTIIKLILRLYDASSGDVIINNKFNLKELNLKSWVEKIGYVDQEPQILTDTIYNNITYGLENVTPEKVHQACKKAKLHDLILSWQDGYDTILFEKGSKLSGGQKQRLVIARLFLKDPEIIILDEATSALDNLIQSEIQQELEKLMIGRTTISIAHRLSTIKSFDKIFVLNENSDIIQIGDFEELIKKPGLFKDLYKINE